MTNNNDNTQPRPWSIREERNSLGEPYWTMWDADGMFLRQFGSHENSRLIVEAVNEHDRLRDLVRRLANEFQGATYERGMRLIREAREAIGEEVAHE